MRKNFDKQFLERLENVYEKSSEDFRICFAGWFIGMENKPLYLIYEENIFEFLAMAIYGVKNWNDINDKQKKRIRKLFSKRFLKKYPQQRLKIESGYNPNIQLRYPNLDLIPYTNYSLFKYVLSDCLRCLTMILLKSMGYQQQIIDNVTFYIRINTKQTKSPPILFLYGLSLGTNTYLLFIRRLTSLNRTIILLDIPYVSMHLQDEKSSLSTILSSIEQLLLLLNEPKITTISHSYGTLLQSSIIKRLSHLIKDQVVIFIDPVCFLLFDSRYMEKFIYRNSMKLSFDGSSAKDLYLIYAFQHYLNWYECNLWIEDIQQCQIESHVFISEYDDIIPVSFIQNYLNKSNINTTILPQFKHGQILLSTKYQDQVLDLLHHLEAKLIK